jgi:hypothetical protein
MNTQANSYMVFIDGEQKGPFSVADIHTMIRDGSLNSSDLVWTEGLEDWVPISSIPDLVTSEPASANPKEEAKSKVPQPNATFAEKVQTSAKLAAAQARLEKLNRIDLSAALTKLGESAYEANFDQAGLNERYEAINELRRNVESLRAAPDIDESASMAEKTMHQAKKGKRALEVEGLLRKQKSAFREIGEVVASLEDVPNDLQQPLAAVHKKRKEIAAVTNEIESLRSKVSGIFAKPGRVLAVVGIVVLGFLTWNFVMPRYENWKASQEVRKQQKIAEAEIAKYEAESKRMEMESLERRKQMEVEQRIATAEREKERLAQKLKREEEDAARSLAREQSEQERKLEEERRKMGAATAQAEREEKKAEDKRNARIAAAAAQEDRKALAAKLLASVPLSPKVVLSGRLQQAGTSVEMRGENIEKLRGLQQGGDWLGLLSTLDGRPMDEYPDARSIESKVSTLQRSDFKLLLRTRFQERRSSELYLIKFPDRYSVVDSSTYWERHPDGIGYLHSWSPKDDPIVIVTGSYETAGKFLNKTKQAYRDKLRALGKKKDLGELTEDAFAASVATLRQRAFHAISQWAAGQ